MIGAGLLLVGGPAFAADPHDLGAEALVDQTQKGVDHAGILDALSGLESRAGISLTVVFVDDFGGSDPIAWANATAVASGRTGPHDVLLAIAIGDRGYGVSVDQGVGLTDSQLSSAEDRDLLPRLQENDWPGAVVAYARALGDLATGQDTGSAAIHEPSGGGRCGLAAAGRRHGHSRARRRCVPHRLAPRPAQGPTALSATRS